MSNCKWKGSYDSGRKYNKTWEDNFMWVKRASDGTENAFQKLCKIQMVPKFYRLESDESRKEHLMRAKQ